MLDMWRASLSERLSSCRQRSGANTSSLEVLASRAARVPGAASTSVEYMDAEG